MGVAKKLTNEIIGWAVLVMVIVVTSIVLINFKDVNGNTSALNTSIDNSVSAFQEPTNRLQIVIIAVIAVAIIGLFIGLFKGFGKKGE